MEKQSWSGELGFIIAAAGAAVGLGNIWSFPRYMAQEGGVLFLLIYLIMAALIGYPLLMCELSMGRETGEKPRGAFRAVAGHSTGGVLGELASLLMMGFYSVLGGCCIRYMLENLIAVFRTGDQGGLSMFLNYISNVPLSAMYTVLFIVISMLVIMAGVSKGLERFSKIAMPLLVIMLPMLIFCAMSLPGAQEGVKAMLAPPQNLSSKQLLTTIACAGAQMFFSISLGQGVMLTYGAYLPSRVSIPKCALAVVFVDTAIAVLASFAVIPAAYSAGGEGSDGSMMMFVTMQSVFDSYGAWGNMFGFLFYLLVLLAALTSAVSLLEVISSFAGVQAGRRSSAVLAAALSAIPAVAIARDGMSFGALPEIMGMSWLDASELVAESLLMPLCTLAMIFALRKVSGEKLLQRQLGERCGRTSYLAMKYLSPPLLIIVMAVKLLNLG